MRMPRTVTLALALLLPSGAAGGSEGRLPDAAQAGDHAAVERLLRAGADVDERAADDTTALHWAAYRGDAEIAALLLAAGADPNAANRNGATPLGMACVSAGSGRGGRPDLVARLLRAGADPTLAPVGEPPLLTCARTGDAGAVRALLADGAEVDAADTWRGQTALMWAAAENHTVVLGELLEAGAGVDTGAGFQQLAQDNGVVLGRRPHERGLPAPRVRGIDLGAVGEQRPHRPGVAGPRAGQQRRLSDGGECRIGAGPQQARDEVRAPAPPGAGADACHPQGGRAVPVGGVRVGARGEQQRRDLRVAAIRRPVEGGGVVGGALVDVRAGPEEALHRGMVAGLRRVGQPALAPAGRAGRQ